MADQRGSPLVVTHTAHSGYFNVILISRKILNVFAATFREEQEDKIEAERRSMLKVVPMLRLCIEKHFVRFNLILLNS